jgi:hypothetical protein
MPLPFCHATTGCRRAAFALALLPALLLSLARGAVPSEKEYGSTREVEKRLADWKPTKENDQVPRPGLRSPKTDVAGRWEIRSDGNLQVSTLTVRRLGQSDFEVELWHGCCVAHWRLKRTARYADGVLVLDRPVEEPYGRVYRRLYAVRIAGRECLLPDVSVAKVERDLGLPLVPFEPSSAEARYAFQRARPQAPAGR